MNAAAEVLLPYSKDPDFMQFVHDLQARVLTSSDQAYFCTTAFCQLTVCLLLGLTSKIIVVQYLSSRWKRAVWEGLVSL